MSKQEEITPYRPAQLVVDEGGEKMKHDDEDAQTLVLPGEVDRKVITEDSARAYVLPEPADISDLEVTREDMLKMDEKLGSMSLERTVAIIRQILKIHSSDQNFPQHVLIQIENFLADPDILSNPAKHADEIREMKLEALLVTENSPYAEVRAVVDNTDDPTMPSFTFRTWVVGIVFSGIGAAVNQLFSLRQPPITIVSEVAQLLAFPAGKLMETLPDWGVTVRGKRHSINPGPFNRKEHMLITIMATVAFNTPYTTDIIVSQYLPQYFNQRYAADFGYQILAGLGTNFCGYGLSGLARRFLIYPSYCVWPSSLVTIALNRAFHSESDLPVKGPFGITYTWTRMRFFTYMFGAMFIYFWFPGFIFTALSTFSWITWIAPNNVTLSAVCGFNTGLGINPWPTFDFNVLTSWIQTNYNPLVMPVFTTVNLFIGMCITTIMTAGIYWTNKWNSGYLPILSNHIYDNQGQLYNVSRAIDDRGIFDEEKYQAYSQPWMSASNLSVYFWFFAQYTSAIGYVLLFHRHEMAIGFKGLWKSIRGGFRGSKRDRLEEEADLTDDIHQRLMQKYKEVPEWWYIMTLLAAMAFGMAGVGAWETYTNPAVVLFGIAMALVFLIPVGLLTAITGMQVTMNVLAELIGGAWAPGNALAMNYFKAYGYITTAQAVYFSNDLKLAHYVKIPPRMTFMGQMTATLVSTFVCTGILNFQLNGIPNVCTADAPFGMSCPGINTFFTAAVFWGTIGPKKVFGNGPYKALLIGFPVGLALPIIMYFMRKRWPHNNIIRQLHPAMICFGALSGSPYNLSYMWPAVPVALLSWVYIRGRYLAFWAKYNFVLAAAWTSGIAIAAIVIFFAIEIPGKELVWWGNTVTSEGCEGGGCVRLQVPEDPGYFGPAPGTFP